VSVHVHTSHGVRESRPSQSVNSLILFSGCSDSLLARGSAQNRASKVHSRQQRLSCGFLLLCAGLFLIRRRRIATRSRSALLKRVRPCLSTVPRDLSDGEFRRVLRMQRHTFSSLLNVIRPDLERATGMALHSSGGGIEPEIRLALTLRLLAGCYEPPCDGHVCDRLRGPIDAQ
jgi:hypothetical protein